MSSARSRELDLTQGVIWKQLLLFFMPIWFGVFFQQLYNTVDTIIVGRLVGTAALAAVGDTAAVIDLLIGFFTGLANGATIVIAQYFGARESGLIGKSSHTAVIISFFAGAAFMVIGWCSSRWILSAMQTPADIIDMSVLYLRIFCLGMIPNAIFNMGTGILRAVGDSRRPVYFLSAACVCNIVLDLVFVVAFRMGVAGVAIATVISQLLSAVLVLWSLARPNRGDVRLTLAGMRVDLKITFRILRIGIPAALQGAMYSLTNIFIQSSVNTFNTSTIAAWATYGKIDFIYWMSVNSLGTSLTTFAGQNFGAGKMDRMKKGVRAALVITTLMTLVYAALLIFCGRVLFSIFTPDEAVIEVGVYMMRVLAPAYILYMGIEMFSAAIRGTGDVVVPVLISIFSVCVMRLVWLFVFLPHFHTLGMLCMSYPISWGVGSVLFFLYYKFGGWKKRRMPSQALSEKE